MYPNLIVETIICEIVESKDHEIVLRFYLVNLFSWVRSEDPTKLRFYVGSSYWGPFGSRNHKVRIEILITIVKILNSIQLENISLLFKL